MTRSLRHFLPLTGLVLTAVLTACSQEAEAPPQLALPVTAASTVRADVPVEWHGVGTVEALSNVAVRAQVGGQLLKVHFTEGDNVRRGQLLFTLDPRPYEAALRAAQAQLARDQALAANAAADSARYADLVKKEYVTAEQAEGKRSGAAALAATVQADEAAVERAKLELGYCRIESPLDGRTGSLQVYAGNLVKANADTPMVVIQQMQPIRVGFAVPQQLLPEIRSRAATSSLQVAVRAPGDATGQVLTGDLSFIDNQVDANSGTIALKATLPNQERALWPGEFVEVSLQLSTLRDAVVAPSAAVQSGQDGTYVYVIGGDDSVSLRPVALGPISGDRTVITSGLDEGERVVTDGQLRLYPGAKVEIKKAPTGSSTGDSDATAEPGS